jgi:hypothetical protein
VIDVGFKFANFSLFKLAMRAWSVDIHVIVIPTEERCIQLLKKIDPKKSESVSNNCARFTDISPCIALYKEKKCKGILHNSRNSIKSLPYIHVLRHL